MHPATDSLADPVILLFSDTLLLDDLNDDLENSISNDDWETTLRRDNLENWKLAPEDPREAALFTYLNPGVYTVQLAAKAGSGFGIVEVFVLPYSLPIYQTGAPE